MNDKISIAKAPARYVVDGPNDQYDAQAVRGSKKKRSAVRCEKWTTKSELWKEGTRRFGVRIEWIGYCRVARPDKPGPVGRFQHPV